MKKKRIRRFPCPHGSIRFVKHPWGYFRFIHKDGTECPTLSQFFEGLKQFVPNEERRPPSMLDLSYLFKEMARDADTLFEHVRKARQYRWSYTTAQVMPKQQAPLEKALADLIKR